MSKTNWKKTFDKNYLGSWDLDDGEGGYKDLKLTIKQVEMKVIKDPNGNNDSVRIAEFKEAAKPMILNVHACETIEGFVGSRYIEDWANCAIQVYVDPQAKLFGGQKGPACRIRTIQPKTELPVLDKNHERFNALVKAVSEKGDSALTAAKKGYTISKKTEDDIKSRAADLKDAS